MNEFIQSVQLYGIETQHGIINGWFNLGAMQFATVNCILSEQTNKQNEITSCETAQVGDSS